LFRGSKTNTRKAGQNGKYTPYVTAHLVISLPKIPYVHRNIHGFGQPSIYAICAVHLGMGYPVQKPTFELSKSPAHRATSSPPFGDRTAGVALVLLLIALEDGLLQGLHCCPPRSPQPQDLFQVSTAQGF